jgi:hypothetical protein
MKTKILFSLFLLATLAVQAQLQTGTTLAGGCVGFNYSSTDDGDTKTTDYFLNPHGYYTLNNNWGVGGGINLSGSTTKYNDGDSKNTSTMYSLVPSARYYGNINDKVICYLLGYIGYGFGTLADEFDGNKFKTNTSSFGLGVRPGILWNIKNRVFLDFSYGALQYNSTTYKPEDSDEKSSDSSFGLRLDAKSLTVGLGYALCGNYAE